jgi:predicted PurR-regulated permease PerM
VAEEQDDEHPLIPLLRSASPARIAIAVGVIALVVGLIYTVRDVATPLFAALGLAYILAPVVDFLEKHRVPRELAVIALMIGVLVMGVGVIALVVPALAAQLGALIARLPSYLQVAVTWISENLRVEIPTDAHAMIEDVKQALHEIGPSALGRVGSYAVRILIGSAGALWRFVSVVLVPLFLFFFLKDWHSMKKAKILLPAPMQPPISAKLEQIDRSLSAYVRGVLTVATILAVFYSVALSSIGVPLGLLIGVLAGFAYVAPFMSSIIGVTLSILFSLLEYSGIGQIVGVLVIFLVGNLFESFFLTPRIVGDKLGLPPLAVILAVMLGGNLFGFLGVLLALPTAAVINVVGRDIVELWRSSNLYKTGLRPSGGSGP